MYIHTPYDAQGLPPTPRWFEYMIVKMHALSLSQFTAPYGCAGRGTNPPVQPHLCRQGHGWVDTSFGEPSVQWQQHQQQDKCSTRYSPKVNPDIKNLCDQVCNGESNHNGRLLCGSLVKLGQVVLVDGHCVDFHLFGICCSGLACHLQHDTRAGLPPTT
jgi:hypothetical protein